MIESLARWFVAQPAHILLVAAALGALWALGRATVLRGNPRANVWWVPAVLWLAYAGWEWLVVTRTPEANIRVDLLLIWPLLGLAMIWAAWRAARGWRARGR
ncbi:MAG: hypothetical protein U1F58_07190 [Burkholderiales bacterium]